MVDFSVRGTTAKFVWHVDFQKRQFINLETSSRDTCRSVIITFAKKLLKATYFLWHRCLYPDIEAYLPLVIVKKFFEFSKWESKINAFQRHLNERVLNSGLVKSIMAKWKQSPLYPAPGTEADGRMPMWERLVDANSLTWFVAPMRESVDWPRIMGANSHLLHYTRASMVAVADAAFELGQGGEGHTRRTGGALSKVWENLALSEEWALLLAQSQTPISPKFGGGEKTRKVACANALPDVEFEDGDAVEKPGLFWQTNDDAKGSNMEKKSRKRKPKSEMTSGDETRQRKRRKMTIDQFLVKPCADTVVGDGDGTAKAEQDENKE